MVSIVKKEWHQVTSQYEFDFDTDILSEIYPDKTEEEIEELFDDLKNGNADLDTLIEDAIQNDVSLDWDHVYDDWWTDRKGGYEVTFEFKES